MKIIGRIAKWLRTHLLGGGWSLTMSPPEVLTFCGCPDCAAKIREARAEAEAARRPIRSRTLAASTPFPGYPEGATLQEQCDILLAWGQENRPAYR